MSTQTEFFRAYTKGGSPAGLGAHCPTCGGGVRYGLGVDSTFEHCNKREPVPTSGWEKLPKKSLSTGSLLNTGNFILTDDLEGCVDGASNTNAFPFENEHRFDWV